MKGQIKNLVMFKTGWVACVGLAAAGQPLLILLSDTIIDNAWLEPGERPEPVKLQIFERELRNER